MITGWYWILNNGPVSAPCIGLTVVETESRWLLGFLGAPLLIITAAPQRALSCPPSSPPPVLPLPHSQLIRGISQRQQEWGRSTRLDLRGGEEDKWGRVPRGPAGSCTFHLNSRRRGQPLSLLALWWTINTHPGTLLVWVFKGWIWILNLMIACSNIQYL